MVPTLNFKQMTSYFAFYLLLLANIYMLWIGMDYSYISITVPVEFNFMVLIIIAVILGFLYPVVLGIAWIHRKMIILFSCIIY